jgi:Flp pilus assembly protein TadG
MIPKHTKPISNKMRGQATVEFGLVAILFFTLLVGIVEVSRAAYGINAITNATREGARWGIAASNQPPSGSIPATACDSNNAGLIAAVNNGVQGIGPITISAAPNSAPTSLGNYCEVTVTWNYQPLTKAFGIRISNLRSTSRQYNN